MSRGIYMDPSIIIWMNGQEMTKYDKESFTKILSSLDKYHAYIKNDPTYTINTMTLGDFDPKYLHIFKNKKLIYQGDLMDFEDGLELNGYKLTDEANRILQKLHNKY